MPDVCFYFQVHQPRRLRRYGVFDVGRRHDYFDDALDEALVHKVAARCYRPMNRLLLELTLRHAGASASRSRSAAARSSSSSSGRRT